MRQWLDKVGKALTIAELVWMGSLFLLALIALVARALYLAWK
jgi:hypothetical protein